SPARRPSDSREAASNVIAGSCLIEDPADIRRDFLRIGLSPAGLHHLADEKAEGLLLAPAVLLDRFRVRLERLAHQLLNRLVVGHPGEAFGLDDLFGRSALGEHPVEDLFRGWPGNPARVDQANQAGEL